jgi:hypothetical protein
MDLSVRNLSPLSNFVYLVHSNYAARSNLCAAVRVDNTRMRVLINKNMCADLTRIRVVRKKQQQHQKQKAKHGADGACRSQIYVYYDEFKVIF